MAARIIARKPGEAMIPHYLVSYGGRDPPFNVPALLCTANSQRGYIRTADANAAVVDNASDVRW
jgi:hypothetical protein